MMSQSPIEKLNTYNIEIFHTIQQSSGMYHNHQMETTCEDSHWNNTGSYLN
jgi:hypothetical protein